MPARRRWPGRVAPECTLPQAECRAVGPDQVARNRDESLNLLRHTMEYRLEYPDYAEALYRALGDDAFYLRMAQTAASPTAAKSHMLKYLDFSMREAQQYGELYTPDGHRHGVSVWLKPLEAERAKRMKLEKVEFLQRHMGAEACRVYREIAAFMSEQSTAIVNGRYWYLSIIGILPRFQNRGLGAGLVTPVLERFDSQGIPSYLETFSERNQGFYRRLGYRAAASFFEPTIGASYTLMTRN